MLRRHLLVEVAVVEGRRGTCRSARRMFVIVPHSSCHVFPEAYALYLALTLALIASAPRGGGGGATTRCRFEAGAAAGGGAAAGDASASPPPPPPPPPASSSPSARLLVRLLRPPRSPRRRRHLRLERGERLLVDVLRLRRLLRVEPPLVVLHLADRVVERPAVGAVAAPRAVRRAHPWLARHPRRQRVHRQPDERFELQLLEVLTRSVIGRSGSGKVPVR